jgi:hypothetical protein
LQDDGLNVEWFTKQVEQRIVLERVVRSRCLADGQNWFDEVFFRRAGAGRKISNPEVFCLLTLLRNTVIIMQERRKCLEVSGWKNGNFLSMNWQKTLG